MIGATGVCGITGFIEIDGIGNDVMAGNVVRSMSQVIRHRGPDAEGIWTDGSHVAMAHRRLSIVDRSSAGNQPMQSKDGRYVMVFNGEIYNHHDLRNQMDSKIWKGQSDTETLIAATQTWGIREALQRSIGMFALAVWDRQEKSLTLARDRFGEKPLFYGWQGNSFLFGSELKSLAAHPAWQGELNRDSVELFMQYGYVPLPYSIWKGIKKLLPGSLLTIRADEKGIMFQPPTFYWCAHMTSGNKKKAEIDEVELTVELDRRLRQAIRRQMHSEVPVGAFLSGGIDSTTVAAIMQDQSSRPIKTFGIGFTESEFNEAHHSKVVAAHLGTDHSEVYVTGREASEVARLLPEIYDEPFGDVSQIPTCILTAMARKHVTVSLSGDGADEIFGGYSRYTLGPGLWRRVDSVPRRLRSLASKSVDGIAYLDKKNSNLFWPGELVRPGFRVKLARMATLLRAESPEDVHRLLVTHQLPTEEVLAGKLQVESSAGLWADNEARRVNHLDISERMMRRDIMGYLTDDILCKVDRASMAVSLETRMPFLDHTIASFGMGLPLNMKIRKGQGKWILRQVLKRYIPSKFIERPKKGFGAPVGLWLRGPLREWAEELIDEGRLRREGIFNPEEVRRRWEEHLTGRFNWEAWLWNVLVFQGWYERWHNS